MKGKIVILGAGHVGSHVARALAAGGIGHEIVLVDIIPEKALAQAMDIADSLSFPFVFWFVFIFFRFDILPP